MNYTMKCRELVPLHFFMKLKLEFYNLNNIEILSGKK